MPSWATKHSPVPATGDNDTEHITAPVTSENVTEAYFLDSETDNSGVTDINNTTPTPQTTSLTSSSCILSKSPFVSSRVPLHANVPQKKKEKIWANEYIDLSTLQDEEVQDISFNIHTGAVLSSTSFKRKFLTIEQWTDTFNVYASVRRVKYPDEAQCLSAYMGLVRRIADERVVGTITIQISDACVKPQIMPGSAL